MIGFTLGGIVEYTLTFLLEFLEKNQFVLITSLPWGNELVFYLFQSGEYLLLS